MVNTTKPIRGPGTQTAREVRLLAEMADIACPELGRKALTVGISPISPLTFPDSIVDAMLETARRDMILGPLPCPIMGATAPLSVAGSVTPQNAEVLASIVLVQLVTYGLPVIYRGRLSLMDPHTGLSVWGSPEIGVISAAAVQTAHCYGLPVDVYGLSTSSYVHDIQSGYERAFGALIPVLAGADEIPGVGEMDGGVNSSPLQLIIDDEILASIKRIRRGVTVDQDALALSVVDKVMNSTGNFLTEMHTVRHLRGGEVMAAGLAERRSWEEWDQAGRDDMADRAQAEAERPLAEHEVPPLTEDQERELDGVLRAAERELARS